MSPGCPTSCVNTGLPQEAQHCAPHKSDPPCNTLQQKTCICSDRACSYTSPIIINGARRDDRGALHWLLCHISNRAEQLATQSFGRRKYKTEGGRPYCFLETLNL